MRSISSVTTQILTILNGATIAPSEQDNITTLQAELRIILKTAAYWPPEAGADLWTRLGTALYRYMPPLQPTGYTAEIDAVVSE